MQDRLRPEASGATLVDPRVPPPRPNTIKQRVARMFSRKREPAFNPGNMEILETIGEGSFATVVHARDRQTKIEYAIKMVNMTDFKSPEALAQLEQESTIMNMVAGSPFIVRLFHTWDVQETRCFALEHVSGGDLFDLLKKERRFESARAAKYVLQLGQAISFIHARGIIFRDLKLENILHDNTTDCIRLIDFGLAKIVPKGQRTSTICGTVQYMAPEVLRHEAYDFRVDWWALGVIAFVFFAGRYPFNKGHGQINNDRSEEDRMVMYNRIVDGIVEFPDDIPAVAADVIRELLQPDPNVRLQSYESLDSQEWFIREGISAIAAQSKSLLLARNSPSPPVLNGSRASRESTSSNVDMELKCENFAQNFIQNYLPGDEAHTGTHTSQSNHSDIVANITPALETVAEDGEASSKANDQSSHNRKDSYDSFFRLLERFQSDRLDNQRSAGPRAYAAILSMRVGLAPLPALPLDEPMEAVAVVGTIGRISPIVELPASELTGSVKAEAETQPGALSHARRQSNKDSSYESLKIDILSELDDVLRDPTAPNTNNSSSIAQHQDSTSATVATPSQQPAESKHIAAYIPAKGVAAIHVEASQSSPTSSHPGIINAKPTIETSRQSPAPLAVTGLSTPLRDARVSSFSRNTPLHTSTISNDTTAEPSRVVAEMQLEAFELEMRNRAHSLRTANFLKRTSYISATANTSTAPLPNAVKPYSAHGSGHFSHHVRMGSDGAGRGTSPEVSSHASSRSSSRKRNSSLVPRVPSDNLSRSPHPETARVIHKTVV